MPWIPSQTKVRCKLAIARIRTVVEKNESLAKRSRREVASLIEVGKIETARIRTESLILQDAHNELMELLELYLELILARFGLLEINSKEKEPDEGIREAVYAVVYAAPRTEVRELHIIREAFMSKYGRDWAIKVSGNENGDTISPRVLSKTNTSTPSKELVDLYLVEIAKAYSLDWRPGGGTLEEQDAEAEEHQRKLGEADAAAQQQQRLAYGHRGGGNERNSSNTPSASSMHGRPDDDAGDEDGGGSGVGIQLPSTPSETPRLGDITKSTTSIPIISAKASMNQTKDDRDNLPTPPPIDPAEAAKTIKITSNISTPSPSSKAGNLESAMPPSDLQQSAITTKSSSSTFDDLAKRFEALKRK